MVRLPHFGQFDYVIFDFETTGLYPEHGDQIVEIGAVKIKQGQIQDEVFETFVNPQRKIPEAATRVNQITNEMVASAPVIAQVLPRFVQFVGNAILVAHNSAFDCSFLIRDLKRLNIYDFRPQVIDTLTLSRNIYFSEKIHNLDAVANRLDININWDRHRSVGDCQLTARVLLHFFKTFQQSNKITLKDLGDALTHLKVTQDPCETQSLF